MRRESTERKSLALILAASILAATILGLVAINNLKQQGYSLFAWYLACVSIGGGVGLVGIAAYECLNKSEDDNE